MAKDADNYDPYERKRDIKQLEKSYMVLHEQLEKNPNHILGACGSTWKCFSIISFGTPKLVGM